MEFYPFVFFLVIRFFFNFTCPQQAAPDAIADLKKELVLLRQNHDAGIVDSALGVLRQPLALPAAIFNPHASLAALEQLVDLAREKGVSEDWCDWEGKPASWAGPLPSVHMVSSGSVYASPSMLRFRDPKKFSAGNLSNCLPCSFLSEGVNLKQFFVPFHGTFQGCHFCSSEPTSMAFPNSPSYERFKDFISRTILERVSNGSLLVWGEVGKVHPPHLVIPITVEPSKPRMCHDERFLNFWIKDCPFTLDYITDLPRYVLPGHFQTSFDDKSGYDHVRLHPSSSTFFGLQWKGWYFVFTTIPFGWKASAFVYHSIGMAATNYIRSLGVPCSQYIDDRHCGQLCLSFTQSSYSGFALAEMAAFIACTILISLGYFIGLKKCVLQPSTALRFLGYICDSLKQAFILPQDKRAKFASLRDSILAHKTVSLKNLQKFAGKTTSFALLAPAAKLFSNEAYRAISRCSKASTSQFRITKDLRKELLHWRFLDSWEGFLPWRDERHFQLTLFSDASFSGWGACLKLPGEAPVETRALFNAVQCLLAQSFNARVDVFVDNKVLLDSWEKQISKSPIISDTLKDLFLFTMAHNLSLSLHYVPSHLNPADQPSRVLSDLDCTLSQDMWKRIDTTFSPHTIDLMALPSNVRHNQSGNPLNQPALMSTISRH